MVLLRVLDYYSFQEILFLMYCFYPNYLVKTVPQVFLETYFCTGLSFTLRFQHQAARGLTCWNKVPSFLPVVLQSIIFIAILPPRLQKNFSFSTENSLILILVSTKQFCCNSLLFGFKAFTFRFPRDSVYEFETIGILLLPSCDFLLQMDPNYSLAPFIPPPLSLLSLFLTQKHGNTIIRVNFFTSSLQNKLLKQILYVSFHGVVLVITISSSYNCLGKIEPVISKHKPGMDSQNHSLP